MKKARLKKVKNYLVNAQLSLKAKKCSRTEKKQSSQPTAARTEVYDHTADRPWHRPVG